MTRAPQTLTVTRVLVCRKRDDIRTEPIGIMPVHQPDTQGAIAREVFGVVLHWDRRALEIVVIERFEVPT